MTLTYTTASFRLPGSELSEPNIRGHCEFNLYLLAYVEVNLGFSVNGQNGMCDSWKDFDGLTLTIIQGINISSRKIRRVENNGPERNRGAPVKSTKLYLVTGILDSPELPAHAISCQEILFTATAE